MLYAEHPFLERFSAAERDGFRFVEYLFPYEWSPYLLQERLQENGLQQVLFNLPPGDWAAGERGIACLPDRREEFRHSVATALRYAEILGVRKLNCLAGLRPGVLDEALAWRTLVGNVAYAAEVLAPHRITVLIEPINSRIDMPGYLIDTLPKAVHLLDKVGLDNVKIQFDLYHMQIMQGDLIRSIEAHLDRIGHIQFADHPGRHQPGTGEINFGTIFRRLDELGYPGWVGAEYRPAGTTEDSLGWLRSFN
jgi:hydroxypyruvate isomerase